MGSRRRRLGRGDFGAFRRYRRELRPHVHGLALLDEDLLDDSAAGRRNLRVDLVCRDLQQALVGLDGVADLLQPLRDRPFRNGDAHLGHDDLEDGSSGH
jgi:hypothetical protein